MPLLVILIRQYYTILPLFEPSSFARLSKNQRAEEIVAFADVFVPNGDDERLFVEVIRTSFEVKLFVEDGVQVAPLDASLVFLPV